MNLPLRAATLLISILPITYQVVYAQSQDVEHDVLTWKVSECKDLVTNLTESNQSEFTTFGDDKVRWSQDNGSVVFTYTVNSTEGSWQSGELIYHTTRKGRAAEFRFKNTSAGIRVVLTYTDSQNVNRIFEFVISEILTQE